MHVFMSFQITSIRKNSGSTADVIFYILQNKSVVNAVRAKDTFAKIPKTDIEQAVGFKVRIVIELLVLMNEKQVSKM